MQENGGGTWLTRTAARGKPAITEAAGAMLYERDGAADSVVLASALQARLARFPRVRQLTALVTRISVGAGEPGVEEETTPTATRTATACSVTSPRSCKRCSARTTCRRYGGEEFVLLLRGTTGMAARIVANRLRSDLAAKPIALGPKNELRHITFSAGVAAADERNAYNADEVVSRADKALYKAKRAGRNRVESE